MFFGEQMMVFFRLLAQLWTSQQADCSSCKEDEDFKGFNLK